MGMILFPTEQHDPEIIAAIRDVVEMDESNRIKLSQIGDQEFVDELLWRAFKLGQWSRNWGD